jgi:Xaa-Pro aminopeptidase
MDLIKAKLEQAIDILNELDIDLWLIFCRESDVMADPALDMIVGHSVVWQSAFFICRDGRTEALVGNYDEADFVRSGRFETVRTYVEDCGKEIKNTIEKYNPRKLAVNYSRNNPAADGLTHGMYLVLMDYLMGTVYKDRVISSENILSLLRGRKIPQEVELISKAAIQAEKCWQQSLKKIKTGMTEKDIAKIIDRNIADTGGTPSFNTTVNAGSKDMIGHSLPSEKKLEAGDLLHVDMGIRLKGFCSDIQRLAYYKRDGENEPPKTLTKAFNMVKSIIDETARLYLPGKKGFTIDAIARRMLKDNGYDVYQHALGHQIGRSVHDGAAIVGPKWKRYGTSVMIPLEEGNTFTVELGINLKDIGYVGLEEDLEVTNRGGRFLCPRQQELTII